MSDELTHVEMRIFFGILILLLAACSPTQSPPETQTTTVQVVERILPSATPPPTSTPYPWTDATSVMSGLCFESVYDATGRTFIIRSADELTQFFDLADNSQLCRHPVARGSFDFSGGTVLVGLWSRAVGCKARHEVADVARDDVARTYVVSLRLVIEGGCGYDLVRPFWIGLSGLAGYDIRLRVQ
jgi:hypothetical protein